MYSNLDSYNNKNNNTNNSNNNATSSNSITSSGGTHKINNNNNNNNNINNNKASEDTTETTTSSSSSTTNFINPLTNNPNITITSLTTKKNTDTTVTTHHYTTGYHELKTSNLEFLTDITATTATNTTTATTATTTPTTAATTSLSSTPNRIVIKTAVIKTAETSSFKESQQILLKSLLNNSAITTTSRVSPIATPQQLLPTTPSTSAEGEAVSIRRLDSEGSGEYQGNLSLEQFTGREAVQGSSSNTDCNPEQQRKQHEAQPTSQNKQENQDFQGLLGCEKQQKQDNQQQKPDLIVSSTSKNNLRKESEFLQSPSQNKKNKQSDSSHGSEGTPEEPKDEVEDSHNLQDTEQVRQEDSLVCWECQAKYHNVAQLRQHLAFTHPDLQIYACSQCLCVYPTFGHLSHHYTVTHLVKGQFILSPNSNTSRGTETTRVTQVNILNNVPSTKKGSITLTLTKNKELNTFTACNKDSSTSAPNTFPAVEYSQAEPHFATPTQIESHKPTQGQEEADTATSKEKTDKTKKYKAAPRHTKEIVFRKRGCYGCIRCGIKRFSTKAKFEIHHIEHCIDQDVSIKIEKLSTYQLRSSGGKVDSKNKTSSSASSLKLKLKISKISRHKGRKRREVKILSEEGMSADQSDIQDKELDAEEREDGAAPGEEEWEEAAGGDSEEQDASRSSGEQQADEGIEEETARGDEEQEPSSQTHQEDEEQQGEGSYDQQEQEQQEDQGYQYQEYQEQDYQEEYQQEESQDYQQDYQKEGGEEEEGAYQGSGVEEGSYTSEYVDQGLSGGGGEESSDAAHNNYQPQFESYNTSNWFTEYESGPRIAAAMAGATTTENANEEGTAWPGGTEGSGDPSYSTESSSDKDSSVPVNGEDGSEDGLFSQAVLGQETPQKTHTNQGGSFEELCLNDSFNARTDTTDQQQQHSDQDQEIGSPQNLQQQQQQQQQQQAGVSNDLLSELEYLNNSGQSQSQGDMNNHPGSGSHPGSVGSHPGSVGSHPGSVGSHPGSVGSPHSGGPSPHSGGPATPSHLSSRGSNSGTPTSGGHPTPPPTDTSFRALASSPMTSPTHQAPTSPSVHKGATPPVTSPGGGEQAGSVPRLTIANNLMASTTSHLLGATTTTSQAGVGGMMGRYGAATQWSQGNAAAAAAYTTPGVYPGLTGTTLASTNMPGPLRPPLPPAVGMQYRPSPPPRVRGRPPLIGHVGRPPLHQASHMQPTRGPGRPPGSSILPPPLMPAPGGRGAMMPPLQRMHQPMYPGQRPGGPQQQNAAAAVAAAAAGKRQLLGAAGHSPSKAARREDINVPSRQKDNECQIIAVANRSDGLPVISNVQGGSGGSSQRGSSVPSTSESTINLSDSITLSVRASGKDSSSSRGERGGPEAGAVANLLASRGITVTPAAGERQEGGSGRDDRRLPTAQELNLSSAISVHPPTQRERESSSSRERDRDGFAVPQAPPTRGSSSSSSSTNSNVERPPRPPTVDLTQDVPSSGAQGTRHKCHQCDRSFPTAALLADHSRVHQQQQQSRMPFKCHLCTAGFSTQKGQQHHYQQFHQLHLSAGDVAIPLVDLRSPVNVQRMAALGIRSFLPLTNLQNRGAGGVVGVPILTLENLRNGHMTLQQWGVSDVLSLGPAKTLNMPR